MTVEELTRRWAERHRFAQFHPFLSLVEDRIELGAGRVLARIVRTRGGDIALCFEGGEERARAQLAVAYMRPIADREFEALGKAARRWANGEKPLVKIAPDGNVWVQNPDGTWTNEGPVTSMTPRGRPTGRRGKDRDRW